MQQKNALIWAASPSVNNLAIFAKRMAFMRSFLRNFQQMKN
jgi:hypothetical protein